MDYTRCKETLIIMIHASLSQSLHTIPGLSKIRQAKNRTHLFFSYGTTFDSSEVRRTTHQLYPFGGIIFVPEDVILHERSNFQIVVDQVLKSSTKTWILLFAEDVIDSLMFKVLGKETEPSSDSLNHVTLVDDLKNMRDDRRIIELPMSGVSSSQEPLEVALDAFAKFQIEACITYKRFIALESQIQPYNNTTKALYADVSLS